MKEYKITEIVQKWPSGTEEVKYRRAYDSDSAKELMKQVDDLPKTSGYFYRHIQPPKQIKKR